MTLLAKQTIFLDTQKLPGASNFSKACKTIGGGGGGGGEKLCSNGY